MTFLEELAGLVLRIQNLRARIDTCEDPEMSYQEREELGELLVRLEKMKGGRRYKTVKVRASITKAVKNEEVNYAYLG